MNCWNSKKIRKWLRIIHRDLGYFAVAISLLYAISGIILNHKKQGVDPAYKVILVESSLNKQLSLTEFHSAWEAKNFGVPLTKVISKPDGYKFFLAGGTGLYTSSTGYLSFEYYKKRPITHFINLLHLNQKNRWTLVGDFSAIALMFLAISGLFMVAGKKGFRKRGIWFMVAGFILVVVFVWI